MGGTNGISNRQLREQMFGPRPAPAAMAPARPPRAAAAPATVAPQMVVAEIPAPPPPALDPASAPAPMPSPDPAALKARLLARAQALALSDLPVRLAFADCGKGLAALLAAAAALLAFAGPMPDGFGWLNGVERFLQPFAMPALMVFAGMFMKRSREAGWVAYARRKLTPVLLALAVWIAAAALLALVMAGVGGRPSLALLARTVGGLLPLAAALVTLPVFLVLWKLLAPLRTGTIFVLAALVELLHTQQGGTLGVELARGLVYFAAGHCWAQHFRALARYVRGNAGPAAAILCVWAALTALLASPDLEAAAGERVSALPFASLGLGLSGSGAMAVAGELIAASRFAGFFDAVGRRWLAFYACLPLALAALAQAMVALKMFAVPAQAVAALICAALGAGVTLIGLELRTPHEPRPAAAS